MPTRPPKLCAHPGCMIRMTGGSYCDKHKKAHTWSHAKNRHERGYGWQWEKIRRLVLKRDSYLCQVCLKSERATLARQVDHIKPKAAGGTDDLGNLQAICIDCHKSKTARE